VSWKDEIIQSINISTEVREGRGNMIN